MMAEFPTFAELVAGSNSATAIELNQAYKLKQTNNNSHPLGKYSLGC